QARAVCDPRTLRGDSHADETRRVRAIGRSARAVDRSGAGGKQRMSKALRLVCGVDEAGRGPLAGPVYAAAVMLDPARRIRGIDDSKQLSERDREKLAPRIKERALAWAVASATVEEIDRLNIYWATMLAMQRAVQALGVAPEEVLVDGNRCPKLTYPARAIVGGDAKVRCIGAASILAKTARDAEMQQWH